MILLYKSVEPSWLPLLLIGILISFVAVAHYIDKLDWDEETKRLMKEYQRTYNKPTDENNN